MEINECDYCGNGQGECGGEPICDCPCHREGGQGQIINLTLNLTQHTATPDQVQAGVIDMDPARRGELARLLTFATLPSSMEVRTRAREIAELARGFVTARGLNSSRVMIGGAPYLMGPLETACARAGLGACYAFSVRESAEAVSPDGTVTKTTVFRHGGFVQVSIPS